MDYRQLAHDIIKKTNSRVEQAEVFISRAKSTSFDLRKGKLESTDYVSALGVGLRVIDQQKLGFAYSSQFDLQSIEQLIKQAIENSQNSTPDQYFGLPSPLPAEEMKLYDENIKTLTTEEKTNLIQNIEELAYQFDPRIKKTEKVSYHDGEGEVFIVNSLGIDVNYQKTFFATGASVIAKEGGSSESGSESKSALKFADLDYQAIGKEAARRAVELLNGKPIKSKKMAVIFDPQVGVQFLGTIEALFSANQVQKGKSLLRGKLDKKIANFTLSIIDDGRLPKGIGSSSYDGEGVPTQKTNLVSEGILKSHLYNTYTANKDERKSTGNAARGGFSTLPGISTHNLYIKPGKVPPQEFITNTKYGLYVTNVMGMHTINPISGDFSVGVAGVLVEKGKKTKAVRGVTIAGNLTDLLNKIEEVGSDLYFMGSVGSPTLYIASLAVSGK